MNTDGVHIEEGADVLDEAILIDNIQKDYQYAFAAAKPFLDIAVSMKLEHDNAVDPRKLPTRSKISIPHKFAQVEEALAKAHEYLWPPSNPVRAVPSGDKATMDDARKVSGALYHMAKDRMACAEESLPIERDCLKIGFGYGIVEPCTFQNLEPFVVDVNNGGTNIGTSKEMGIGETTKSLRLRYISGGQVIPYPDGWTTNGPSRASTIFFWDFMTEHEFRNLCSTENTEGLDFDTAKLTTEEIERVISSAKTTQPSFAGATFDYIAKLGGIDYKALQGASTQALATIPVLKVYREDEHVWLANGQLMVYRQAARVQTYRCPILKMCAVRDAMHWYPYTTSEALMDINWARNVWINLITDITTWSAKRPLIYSTNSFDEPPEFGPDSAIPTNALDARNGAAYLTPPALQNGDIQLGQILDERAAAVSGEKDFMQKNYSRGGQNAFNDLLNSSRGRERLAGAVMESGFIKDLFTQILIYMQIEGLGYTGNTIQFDEQSGQEKIVRIDVTGDDMKQSFSISISLDAKRTATEFTPAERLQIFQVIHQDPSADPYENYRFLLGSDELTHRIVRSKDVANDVQSQNRADARAATQAGIAKAQGRPAAPPELAGAIAGGA